MQNPTDGVAQDARLPETQITEIRDQIVAYFVNSRGQAILPGNVGSARTLLASCNQALQVNEPCMFETLQNWDNGTLKPRVGPPFTVLDVCRNLHAVGLWETAWALAHLYYDQFQKEEARRKQRLHKGHAACGLAILAREIGSPSLTRHFAMISSAGDIYFEGTDPELKFGGYAMTMLEQFQSEKQQQNWRQWVREAAGRFPQSSPLYLEAFLAAQWFGSNGRHVLDLAPLPAENAISFPEVLLAAVEAQSEPPWLAAGTRFEAAAGLLLSQTPGFEVDSSRKTSDEQIDLVVRFVPDALNDLGLEQGFGLVECKASKDPVSVSELRDFGAKCWFHRVKFGILVARAGLTGGAVRFAEPQNAELVRRRFQLDGLTLLVLDISQLRAKSRNLRGLAEELRADIRRLVFGPIP